ncbi:3-hydroxyacyl-CoA dehydrogenase NAD-binding domain-containing protein [Streptomyces sp. VRA16 Mangrove soil]|uniref:3-hydroxyacyl-CoA dehydrogenase NAD-binding domain-containing protein n=1 Tax=Streptomyces sp. VRA16 Mangrove soil TaxID=2817434 RepID=UPI001A9D4F91|nr:3-hydroxyacyl-CoA dehydrogenase NAD-binding domain-containing protein [Streptomyces sp. VRA16 Mangrove soil]MBO1332651.1 hydroxylacyl-CoA dehydrogenase [Streptomyces sp. VRA16 Mangrove soil]
MSVERQRTAAVIGTGTIALGWIALFAARGLEVRVSSTRQDAESHVRGELVRYAATLPDGAVAPEELSGRITFAASVEAAVDGADVVQENAPEDLALKQKLFARIAAAAPKDALLLSSTSTLLPDDLGAELPTPGRAVVGHPFNPPHIVPLVEVVASAQAETGLVDRAVGFYRSLGKTPVVLRRAVPGFVANRLQSALLRESIHLVREGVVTVDELDAVVTASIGSRWAVVGPFQAFHLGGGAGGLRHWFAHLGDGLERSWEGLGRPPVDETTVALLLAQADASFGQEPYDVLAARRDRGQNAVIAALTEPS